MTYDLDFLSAEDSRRLFLLHYSGAVDTGELDRLLEMIGYHTLTIELLAKTLEKNFTIKGIGQLIAYLENRQLNSKELEILVKISHSDEEVKIYSHLMKAFEISGLTGYQQKILRNFSILPSVDIAASDLLDFFLIDDREQIEFVNAVDELTEKGWLKSTSRGFFRCHQIIQEIMRYRLVPNAENCAGIINYFGDLFLVKVPENPLKKKRFIVFGESILNTIDDRQENVATLADNFAKTLRYFGYNDKALEFARKGESIREEVLAPDDPRLGDSYVNISVILRYLDRHKDSLDYGLKSLNFFLEQPNRNYVKIATALYKITLCYIKLGDLESAMSYSRRDIRALSRAQKLKQLKKAERVYFAETYNTRGEIYRELGQFEHALTYKLRALKIREERLEKNHPDIAISYHQIAKTYFQMDNAPTSKKFVQKAIRIRRSLPDEHPDLRESLDLQAEIDKTLAVRIDE